MRPFTQGLPKPLIPVMDIPLVQYSVDLLNAHGITQVIANIHHLPELMRRGLAQLDWGGMAYSISDESDLLLGNAGGMAKAYDGLEIDGPVVIINADMLTTIDVGRLLDRHRRLRDQYGVSMTLTTVEMKGEQGQYRQLIEDPDRPDLLAGTGEFVSQCEQYAGVGVYEREAFKNLPRDQPSVFYDSVLKPAMEQSKVGLYSSEALWVDVGTPALWWNTHQLLMKMLADDRADLSLWKQRLQSKNNQIHSTLWCSEKLKKETRDIITRQKSLLNGSYFGAEPTLWSDSDPIKKKTPYGESSVIYSENLEENLSQPNRRAAIKHLSATLPA